MGKQFFFRLIDNVLHGSDTQVEFFSYLLIANSIDQRSLQDRAIPFCVSHADHPSIYLGLYFLPWMIFEFFFHRLFRTTLVFSPLTVFLFFFVRFLTVTLGIVYHLSCSHQIIVISDIIGTSTVLGIYCNT